MKIDPSETLTIFGQEVKQSCPGSTDGWMFHVADLVVIVVEPTPSGAFEAAILSGPEPSYNSPRVISNSPGFSTKQDAANWSEQEVRRLLTEAAQACGGEVTWATKQNEEAS